MDALLEIALRAALAGGEEVMRVYADPFEVTQKEDRTPVTEADLASERAIVAILSEAVSGHPDRLRGDRAGRGVLVAGFAVLVRRSARRDKGVHRPQRRVFGADRADRARQAGARGRARPRGRGDVYRAGAGHGDAAAQGRRFRADPARAPSPEGIVVIHSRSHENSRRLAEYFQDRPVIERRQCGSALKFGALAAGEADFYPRFGTTMEWDTAAGQAVLEAAGGHVLGLDGERLSYGKPGLKNDGFVAWGAKPAW